MGLRGIDGGPQLSFDVKQHPDAAKRNDGGWLDGEVKIGSGFSVDRDLNPGDELTVSIADADGEVIASGTVRVAGIAFVPIALDGDVVGICRVHKAKAK